MSMVPETITSVAPNGYGGEGRGIPPLLDTFLPPTQITQIRLSRGRLEVIAMAVLHPFLTSALEQLGSFHGFPNSLVGAELFEGFVDEFWLGS